MTFSGTLADYYRNCFPVEIFTKWLSLHTPLSLREFSYTLNNDIYVRYKSFEDHEQFRNDLIRNCPLKIDIGAAYSITPASKRSSPDDLFTPIFRELVFDIDISDYDEMRQCCKDKAICQKCWLLIAAAMKIVDSTLKHVFGFKHVIWFFSGRRGVHCWVNDKDAGQLDVSARRAIVSFLQGGDPNKEDAHPASRAALDISLPLFLSYIGTQERSFICDSFTKSIKDPNVRNKVEEAFHKNADPKKTWKAIHDLAQHFAQRADFDNLAALPQLIQKSFVFPRLDANVSIQLSHLIKAPFCIHPSTNNICVPIPIDDAENFVLSSVPTASSIVSNMDLFTKYVDYFGNYLKSVQ